MKKRLSIIILCLSIVASLAIISAGCTCGTSSDANATTPFDQLTGRVGTLEGVTTTHTSQIAAIQGDIATLTVPDLTDYVLVDDLPDLTDYVTQAEYAALVARVTALEAEDEEENGNSSATEGEVTVELQMSSDTFATNPVSSSQFIPVKISNDTGDYQQVQFGLIMRCVTSSPNNVAEGAEITLASVNTGYPFSVTGVPGVTHFIDSSCNCFSACPDLCSSVFLGDCQQVLFTWVDSNALIIQPNSDYTAYVRLDGLATSLPEIWQISIHYTTITEL